MADGRHSENHYISISQLQIVRIIRNLVCGHRFYPRRRKRDKKMRNNAIQDGGRPPFWKSLYLHISAANRPNYTKFSMRTQILSQATETWQKMRNNAIQDGGRMPYWKSFFGYNSTPSCPIKTKFRVRSHNRTHTKVRWWKCPISKMQHGGRPQFWKSLYLQISATNRPNCTKFSMHTQILPQATETTKNQKLANSKWRMDAALKIAFWL